MKRGSGRAMLWVLVLGLLGAVACQTTSNTVVAPDTGNVAPAAPAASAAPASPTTPPPSGTLAPVASAIPVAEPAADNGAKMCGCSLCAPLPSTDACTTDADCAPSVPCHAPACVAKAKAVPRKPDQVCTMMMGCQTADANACTCWKGTCALTPRKP